mmetsp:Transcript_33007/g.129599  ORF Transcript_33007/g.129599 Transcript_33007/m.129599 type:complete len:325 (-) Transcript_33007:171-1145(-)
MRARARFIPCGAENTRSHRGFSDREDLAPRVIVEDADLRIICRSVLLKDVNKWYTLSFSANWRTKQVCETVRLEHAEPLIRQYVATVVRNSFPVGILQQRPHVIKCPSHPDPYLFTVHHRQQENRPLKRRQKPVERRPHHFVVNGNVHANHNRGRFLEIKNPRFTLVQHPVLQNLISYRHQIRKLHISCSFLAEQPPKPTDSFRALFGGAELSEKLPKALKNVGFFPLRITVPSKKKKHPKRPTEPSGRTLPRLYIASINRLRDACKPSIYYLISRRRQPKFPDRTLTYALRLSRRYGSLAPSRPRCGDKPTVGSSQENLHGLF